MGNFKFGEHSTKDFDLVIQAPPTYNFPSRDVTVEHIPGRNGDLVIDNKCWQNTDRTYSIASIFRPGTNFIANSERLIKWLTSLHGYYRLEDSYDPDVYRLAEFKDSGSLTNYYDKATVLNVTFNCKPQRYLKNGEKPVKFSGSVAVLENPTGYESLPLITINNVYPEDNELLLLTVKNDDKVDSIITINKMVTAENPYDVIIDSEMQLVYSIQNGDLSYTVNLNNTEFPSIKGSKSIISIDKYLEDSGLVATYNSLINADTIKKDSVVLAKYQPYESIVASKQVSFNIISFDLLKQKAQEVYEMQAYANYCLDNAEHYIFISFNTLLQNNAAGSYSFQGIPDDRDIPDWLYIEPTENGLINIYYNRPYHMIDNKKEYDLSQYAYIFTSNTKSDFDKNIIRVKADDETDRVLIASNVKVDNVTIGITLYPTTNDGKLKIDYTEDYTEESMPDWLYFSINEKGNDDKKYVRSITYGHNKTGYYYIPKGAGLSAIFTKAGWKKMSSQGELTTIKWQTYKKAFVPTGSTSTTASLEYYFLPYPYKGSVGSDDYQEYIQYKTIYTNELDKDGNVKKDEDGNPIPKPSNIVHFDVIPLDDELAHIKLVAKDAGFFRLNNAEQKGGWRWYNADVQIISSEDISVKSSQIVYYLSKIPDYSIVEDWPDWINPNQLLSFADGQQHDDPHDYINADYVDFVVNRLAWYMYTYYPEGESDMRNTKWAWRAVGNSLGQFPISGDDVAPKRKSGTTFNLFKIEGFYGYNSYNEKKEYVNGDKVIYATMPFDCIAPEGEIVTGPWDNSKWAPHTNLTFEEHFPVKEFFYTDSNGNRIKNIGFYYMDETGTELLYAEDATDQKQSDLPSWLKVDVVVGSKDDYSDYNLNFYPAETGLYKWDTNTVWLTKQSSTSDVIVSSTATDDTSIYFMDSVPQYPTQGTIYDKVSVSIELNALTGNPESINIYAKVEGYYKAKNDSSWKYFNEGDLITNSKISEESKIYYLTKKEETLDDIEILVIPRWWSL